MRTFGIEPDQILRRHRSNRVIKAERSTQHTHHQFGCQCALIERAELIAAFRMEELGGVCILLL